MSILDPYLRYYRDGNRADFGRRPAMVVSVSLHLAVVLAMVWFSQSHAEPPKPLNAMPVALVQRSEVNTRGKKRKAPVQGRERQRTKPTEQPPKPTPALKPDVKTGGEIGLKKDRVKPQPKKDVSSQAEQPVLRQPKPEVTPPKPVDTAIPIGSGGLGGEDEAGLSLEVGNPDQQIDVKDVEFLSYFRLIHAQIGRRWTKGSLTGGVTTVRFHIARDGSISNVSVTRSAGKPYLDGPAKRAVMGAELPPLPQGLKEDELVININFHYGTTR